MGLLISFPPLFPSPDLLKLAPARPSVHGNSRLAERERARGSAEAYRRNREQRFDDPMAQLPQGDELLPL